MASLTVESSGSGEVAEQYGFIRARVNIARFTKKNTAQKHAHQPGLSINKRAIVNQKGNNPNANYKGQLSFYDPDKGLSVKINCPFNVADAAINEKYLIIVGNNAKQTYGAFDSATSKIPDAQRVLIYKHDNYSNFTVLDHSSLNVSCDFRIGKSPIVKMNETEITIRLNDEKNPTYLEKTLSLSDSKKRLSAPFSYPLETERTRYAKLADETDGSDILLKSDDLKEQKTVDSPDNPSVKQGNESDLSASDNSKSKAADPSDSLLPDSTVFELEALATRSNKDKWPNPTFSVYNQIRMHNDKTYNNELCFTIAKPDAEYAYIFDVHLAKNPDSNQKYLVVVLGNAVNNIDANEKVQEALAWKDDVVALKVQIYALNYDSSSILLVGEQNQFEPSLLDPNNDCEFYEITGFSKKDEGFDIEIKLSGDPAAQKILVVAPITLTESSPLIYAKPLNKKELRPVGISENSGKASFLTKVQRFLRHYWKPVVCGGVVIIGALYLLINRATNLLS